MNMKKKAFLRGLLGFPLGISIGYAITVITSLSDGSGGYSPVVPELIETIGSEIGAVVFQAVLWGVLGAVFGAASVIWDIERWSIAKQTGLYFLSIAAAMLPIAWFARWMEHSVTGFLLYAAVFLAIFVLMWVIQYCVWKVKIKNVNRKMEGRK